MSLPLEIQKKNRGLSDWAILVGYRGSISHDMFVPSNDPNSIDDKDIMAVCIPPKDYFYGLKNYGSRGTQEIKKDEWDIVIYEIRKFISLLSKGNPNVLSMLWLDEEFILFQTDEGKYLREKRDLFVGRHVYHSFVGYAQSQLYKMEHLACQGYMGEKRKRLVEKFGYDTKNAAHLIRLMRMAIEFLQTGFLIVKRPDREELLGIKKGQWTLEQIKQEAEILFQKAKDAYEKSPLPQKPDELAINELCVTLCERHFSI